VPKSEPVTLEYLMKDYVVRLKHPLSNTSRLNNLVMQAGSTNRRHARLGILISGRGSNMIALADAVRGETIPKAEVAVVISDQANAAELVKAQERGIETLVIERGGRRREDHDRQIVAALRERNIDLICLAGYMRLLKNFSTLFPAVFSTFIKPAAAVSGLNVAGARSWREVSGCTVHYVDETLDGGPIIAQRRVPVHGRHG
jgi:phosphoribosylglycinamide formyltransferase-1